MRRRSDTSVSLVIQSESRMGTEDKSHPGNAVARQHLISAKTHHI
jgi:hypothetical protein